MNRKAQLWCAWSIVPFTVLLGFGYVVLAGFIPPPHPAESAQQIKALYLGNLTGIRVGMCLFALGMVFLPAWGAALAIQSRRIESGVPIFTYVQVGCLVIATTLGELIALVFAVAAFRPDVVSPEITRVLNDVGWFLFIWPWPPVGMWYVAVGIVILRDSAATPVFPRWSAYMSFWIALLSVPSCLIVFFKHGVFGFSGLFALYIPLTVLFGWFVVMTVLLIKAINREAAESTLEERSPAPTDLARAIA
ncbi:MAG: hypothetical protein ACYDHH_21020 [Solirubrobacteraceae bacterium]